VNTIAANRIPSSSRRALAGVVAWVTLSTLSSWAGSVPVTIEIRARALAPGELLRIDVSSPAPIETLEGEFLGGLVFLVRSEDGSLPERWSGWAMIGLDEPPGLASVELRGRAASGHEVLGTRALTIEAREFPEERLGVAPKYVEPPQEVQQRLARERVRLTAVYTERRPASPPATPFVRPVPGEQTSVFGTRRVFNGTPRSPHSGLDLRAATGTPVRSSGPGLVTLAMDLYYSGNTVIVDHGGGLFTIYAHLSALRVEPGDRAESGQVLGLSGATGRVTGPHLHWGAKIGDRPFDPAALLDPTLFR